MSRRPNPARYLKKPPGRPKGWKPNPKPEPEPEIIEPPKPPGRHPKLHPIQIEEIRRRKNEGMTIRELAAEYGVSDTTISRVCPIKQIAIEKVVDKLLESDKALKELPKLEQSKALRQFDAAREMLNGLIEVANSGVRTAKHLSKIAENKGRQLTNNSDASDLEGTVAFRKAANVHSELAATLATPQRIPADRLGLKDAMPETGEKFDYDALTTDELIALQALLKKGKKQ